MRLRLTPWMAAGSLLALLTAEGCDFDWEQYEPLDQATAGAGGAGTGGVAAAGGIGGGGAVGMGGDAGSGASGTAGSGGTGGTGPCAPDVLPLEVAVLNMIIIVDQSGSMGPSGAWDDEVTALSNFVTDPQAVGLDAALNYFPFGAQTPCLLSHYDPPQLSLTDLASSANAVVTDLNAHSTPQIVAMSGPAPALEGSLDFAESHKAQHASHEVVVVLLSDDEPNDCEQNIGAIASLAASALSASGVRTHGIALDSGALSFVSQVAAAGGGQDFDNSSNILQVEASLQTIHEQAFPCSHDLPQPPNGPLEPDEVNVTYTPGGGGSPQLIPRADGSGDCGDAAGWYYDQQSGPTQIILCDATCNDLRLDPTPQLDVELGCPTVEN